MDRKFGIEFLDEPKVFFTFMLLNDLQFLVSGVIRGVGN